MSNPRKAFVQSFGCRASQADGAALEESLRQVGFEPVREAGSADLVVLNTCTVTHSADVDARRLIRGIHRDNPQAQIAVTGCYAQRAPSELIPIEGVSWVIGNSHKTQLANLVAARLGHEEFHGQIAWSEFERAAPFAASPVRGLRDDRTRPNLKVQDGCDNRCSFCIIPSVRGPSRGASVESAVEQVAGLARRYREVVLTGINLGRWGRDLDGRPRFPFLLRQLLDRTSIARLRISSIEPMDWSDELIELMAGDSRIAQHVHMPLQSGSDGVLKRMFRRYRTRHYSARLLTAWRKMPDAAFGADVMTGFPGETEAEFDQTLRFVEEHPFTYLHVFTYSERPGTAAALERNAVPMNIRRARTETLRRLSAKKTSEFQNRMVGRTLSAVTLEEPGIALTTNFLRVEMSQSRSPNLLVDLAIGQASQRGLREASLLNVIG